MEELLKLALCFVAAAVIVLAQLKLLDEIDKK